MPEYYGYQAPEQVNLGKSIANVAELFASAEEKRTKKRETEQKSLDESRKKINEIEQTSNQSMNGVINNGANSARNYILELERMRKSGQITGAEFNRRMTNLNDSWDNFAFTTKNFNERLAENLARQQSGEASANEIFLAQIQGDLLKTQGKNIIVGEDGGMYMIDEKNPDTPISLRGLGNLDNIVDNKVDVATLVQNGVSKWGDFSVESGTTTESGARLQNELYDAAKYDLIASIVDKKNPKAIVSILLDNGGKDYDQYYNNTQKEELLNDAVTRQEALTQKKMTPEEQAKFRSEYEKNNMIKYEPDQNGSYQPVVTDNMVKEAFELVDRNVEMQVGRTKTEDEDRGSKGGGPSGPTGKIDVTPYEVNLASTVINAWANKDWEAIRRATNNKYYFKWEDDGKKKGLSVYDEDPDEYEKELKQWNKLSAAEKIYTEKPKKPVAIRRDIMYVKQLADQFFGGTEQDKKKWEAALQQARGGGSTETPKVKPGAADELY